MAEGDQNSELPASPRREKMITLRLDEELFDAATKKTEPYGLAATLRGLLRSFVRGDIGLSREELEYELRPAPRKAKRRPRSKPKAG